MIKLEKALHEEKERIENLLTKVELILREKNSDSAKIRVFLHKGEYVQMLIKDKGDEKYKYLPVSELPRATNIVKLEYYTNLKKCLEKKLKQINVCIAQLGKDYVHEVYEKLGKGKQQLVEPIEMTDEEYRKCWENVEYSGKGFVDGDIEIYTERGERVRSKSEKIIADKLYKEGVAYRYEYPLQVDNMMTIYPDFTILDEKNRKNIILEHFGLMDHDEYANNAVGKMGLYAREGYNIGDNLFFTMETVSRPLDSRVLDGIIEKIKKQ